MHKRCCDRDVPSLVSRLHDWRVDAGDGVGKRCEVGEDEAVVREVGGKDVEELHEARGNVFGYGQVRGQGEVVAPAAVGACEPVRDVGVGDGGVVGGACGDVTEFEVAGC